MKIKKILPILGLSLALVACAGDNDTTDNTSDDTSMPVSTDESIEVVPYEDESTSDETTSNEVMDMDEESKLSPMEVVDKAKEGYEDYELESISYDMDDGEYYEVTLFMDNNEVSMHVDPMTGEIIKKEEEMDDDTKTALDEKYLDNIQEHLDKAIEDADADGNMHYIDEWSLEMEDGRALLETEVFEKESKKEAYTYKIDPEDGKVLEKEIED